VLHQSYFLPFGVKTLTTTATSHGITQKFLLIGTLSDQVRRYILDGSVSMMRTVLDHSP